MIGYVVFDSGQLAWAAVVALVLAATLGLMIAVRWVGVYRAGRAAVRSRHARQASHLTLAGGQSGAAVLEPFSDAGPLNNAGPLSDVGPPERNFPLPVVVGHGAFAAATITLVLLTALGVGGS